jgi:hypothetical protein
MSNRENSQSSSSANIEIVQNHLITNWETIGDVSVQDRDKFKLKMPKDIPASPGVYRIIAAQSGEAYIGEGKNLAKRLHDYENAGYKPDRKAATNRSVQGWIYRLLEESSDSVQISLCTHASIIGDGGMATELDLHQKYFRMLIESLTIFNHKDLKLRNKQFE